MLKGTQIETSLKQIHLIGATIQRQSAHTGNRVTGDPICHECAYVIDI